MGRHKKPVEKLLDHNPLIGSRDKMLSQYDHLINDEASKYKKLIMQGYKEDLMQEGRIGLLLAYSRYSDPSVPFRAFAIKYAKGHMLNFIRDRINLIRPNRKQWEKKEWDETLVSLNTVYGADHPCELIDLLPSDDFEDGMFELKDAIDRHQLLNSQEKQLIYMAMDGKTQEEIGRVKQVSQMTISRYIKRVRKKLTVSGY